MTSKLPINLENLLRQRQVEGERIEYKAGWNPDAILRTLCAFANDFENLGGGYVVIGQDCDTNGRPVFPPVGLEENQLDKIQQELLGFCNLIQPPYFPLLSVERFAERNLLVLWAPGGLSRPYKVPKSVTSKIKEYRYYIHRNYLKETVIKHPLRAEAERFWNFPHAAIEEAVVNAVYHRSYEIREPVEIRITREDLVVLSFPGPDRSISLKDLEIGKAVSRRYRNRRIGEFLKELDLTEGRSTGISKIIKAMAANGSPAPEFETDSERSYFLIRLPVHEKATNWSGLLPESGSEKPAPSSEKGSEKGSEKPAPSSEKASGETAGRVVEMIRQKPAITIGELAMELGISTRAVEKQVAKLKDTGRIQREGSDRGGHWVIFDSAASGPRTTIQEDVRRHQSGSEKTTQEALGDTTQETTQEKILTLLRADPALTRFSLAQELGITADGVKYHLDKLKAAGKIQHHGPTKAGHWKVIDKP